MTKIQALKVRIINAIDEKNEKWPVTDREIEDFLRICEIFDIAEYMIDFIGKNPGIGFHHYLEEAVEYTIDWELEDDEEDNEDDIEGID